MIKAAASKRRWHTRNQKSRVKAPAILKNSLFLRIWGGLLVHFSVPS